MKQLLSILFLLVGITVLAQEPVRVVPKPAAGYIVYDGAGVLDSEQEKLLNDQLVSLDNTTSNQIAVATIKTLDGGNLEEVANATFREWGIGTAKKNNGVLILIVTDDRKIRIEVGYGLEGAIPDGVAGSIIRNDMRPYFKQGDYYHGILKAAESIGKAASGEYKEPREKKSKGIGGGSIFKFIIIAIIVLIFIARGGGGGGSMMSRRGSRGWVGPTWFPGGFGGSSGGGFGGGDFGGGFGGFGGGSSGGGGASGSW